MSEPQFVDPAVSRRKFDREVAEFRSQANEYGRRGWFLADAEFPRALVILATATTQPVSIMCGVLFDYLNYDAAPPSVRLVHPLTREPYRLSKLPTRLPRRVRLADAGEAAQPVSPGVVPAQLEVAPYMQALSDDDTPFLCMAGVREYHQHPAHSGDHWELHRPSGAGRLVRLVAVISKYGLETIKGLEVQMQPVVRFSFGVPPE